MLKKGVSQRINVQEGMNHPFFYQRSIFYQISNENINHLETSNKISVNTKFSSIGEYQSSLKNEIILKFTKKDCCLIF